MHRRPPAQIGRPQERTHLLVCKLEEVPFAFAAPPRHVLRPAKKKSPHRTASQPHRGAWKLARPERTSAAALTAATRAAVCARGDTPRKISVGTPGNALKGYRRDRDYPGTQPGSFEAAAARGACAACDAALCVRGVGGAGRRGAIGKTGQGGTSEQTASRHAALSRAGRRARRASATEHCARRARGTAGTHRRQRACEASLGREVKGVLSAKLECGTCGFSVPTEPYRYGGREHRAAA